MRREFLKDYAVWQESGEPIRSAARVTQLFNDYCSTCPLLVAEKCSANGGSIAQKTRRMNFLSWATSVCPKGNFKSEPGTTTAEPKEPRTIHQIWTFTSAVAKWKSAGSPLRSQPEIDRIFAVCQACPQFINDGSRPRCRLCGCSLNQGPNGLTNKIAMATETCPIKPSKW